MASQYHHGHSGQGFQEAGLFPVDASAVTSPIKADRSKLFSPSQQMKNQQLGEPIPSVPYNQEEGETTSTPQQATPKPSTSAVTSQPAANMPPAVVPQLSTVHVMTPDLEPTPQSPTTSAATQDHTTTLQPSQALPPSPFSKHLKLLTPRLPKAKPVGHVSMPKAITGMAYRKLMEEKNSQREEERRAKEKCKEDRIQKRKMKEEEKMPKKAEVEAKCKRRTEEKKNKKEQIKQLQRALEESGSDTDQDVQVDRMKCYKCEKPYSTDYIECTNCLRRFHIECTRDDYMIIESLEFECKYC